MGGRNQHSYSPKSTAIGLSEHNFVNGDEAGG